MALLMRPGAGPTTTDAVSDSAASNSAASNRVAAGNSSPAGLGAARRGVASSGPLPRPRALKSGSRRSGEARRRQGELRRRRLQSAAAPGGADEVEAGETRAAAKDEAVRLRVGRPHAARMDLSESTSQLYRVDVPDDARSLRIHISGSPADFRILAMEGEIPDDDAVDEGVANGYMLDEQTLLISRHSTPPLVEGAYYLLVEAWDVTPRQWQNRLIWELPYQIEADVVRHKVDGEASPGRPFLGRVSMATGGQQCFRVRVPKGAKALRIDLAEARADLDLMVSHGVDFIDASTPDFWAEGVVSNEVLLLDAQSDPPLQPGEWFVHVADQSDQADTPFVAHVHFSSDPPPELLKLPALPQPAAPRDRAVHATVHLLSSSSTGSGVLISADGWLLSNDHVVSECVELARATEAAPELACALTFDPREPPRELFRARVVKTDRRRDLALLKIHSGYYGQPLAPETAFPYVPIGRSEMLELGATVHAMGYPSVARIDNTPSLTLSSGVLSGRVRGDFLKTDADLSGGNSGGSAFNDRWQLIGVPTMTISDSAETSREVGILVESDSIPFEWLQLAGARRAR